MKPFADLHCHIHLRNYLWLCRLREELKAKCEYHAWHTIPSDLHRLNNARRATGYSQGDLVMLTNGGARLVVNSLYPLETGFLKVAQKPSRGSIPVLRHLLRLATHHRLPLRAAMQRIFMRIPVRTIRYMQSDKYSYWETLCDEYDFLLATNGKRMKNKIYDYDNKVLTPHQLEKYKQLAPQVYEAEGMYTIPRNREELQRILDDENGGMAMVLSAEGAHIFGTDKAKTLEELLQNVRKLKSWEHPFLFITLAHHFFNKLCGHARSFPEKAIHVLNQDEGLNSGFTEWGWALVRELLGIDANNERKPELGYRILPDFKHLSVQGRKEFYEQILAPCYAKGDVIPVIVSHAAYSGIKTIDELLRNMSKEGDKHRTHTPFGTFYSLNMNSCDEDIHWIFKTRGIYGVVFERRVLGVSQNARTEKQEKQDNIGIIWANLRAVVQVVYDSPDYANADKHTVWDRLALGTDFDGYIESVDGYKSALDLPKFRQDLITHLQQEVQKPDAPAFMHYLRDVLGIERAVDKICYDNAKAFIVEHYPK